MIRTDGGYPPVDGRCSMPRPRAGTRGAARIGSAIRRRRRTSRRTAWVSRVAAPAARRARRSSATAATCHGCRHRRPGAWRIRRHDVDEIPQREDVLFRIGTKPDAGCVADVSEQGDAIHRVQPEIELQVCVGSERQASTGRRRERSSGAARLRAPPPIRRLRARTAARPDDGCRRASMSRSRFHLAARQLSRCGSWQVLERDLEAGDSVALRQIQGQPFDLEPQELPHVHDPPSLQDVEVGSDERVQLRRGPHDGDLPDEGRSLVVCFYGFWKKGFVAHRYGRAVVVLRPRSAFCLSTIFATSARSCSAS